MSLATLAHALRIAQLAHPGPSAEICRGFSLYNLWKILPGIFLEASSGHFVLQKKLQTPPPKKKSVLAKPTLTSDERRNFCRYVTNCTLLCVMLEPLELRSFLHWGRSNLSRTLLMPLFCQTTAQ